MQLEGVVVADSYPQRGSCLCDPWWAGSVGDVIVGFDDGRRAGAWAAVGGEKWGSEASVRTGSAGVGHCLGLDAGLGSPTCLPFVAGQGQAETDGGTVSSGSGLFVPGSLGFQKIAHLEDELALGCVDSLVPLGLAT